MGPASKLAPVWISHGITASFRLPPAPGGSLLPHGQQGRAACPWSALRAAEEPQLWCLLTSCCPFCTALGGSQLFSHILLSAATDEQGFFIFFKYITPELLPPSLVGLTSISSALELAGSGFVGHRGSQGQLLIESTSVALLLWKLYSANPTHI